MKRVCGLVIALAGSALGQTNTFEFVVSNTISPDQPSATIELWATWDPTQYAFAKGMLDVTASPDPGVFSDPERLLKGPQTEDGEVTLDGDSVLGIVTFPRQGSIGGPYADTSNPIAVWRATWSTSDFHPRTVSLATLTQEYLLYTDPFGSAHSFLDDFVEGAGSIQVVPAPPSVALLFIGPIALLRRAR